MNEHKICCPVCTMTVMTSSLKLKHEGIHYFFCSSQCMSRFRDHPHLYVGNPKLGKSVKQKHLQVLKKRQIYLNELLNDELKQIIDKSLKELMGVKEINIGNQELFVTYDLLEVSLEAIEKKIEASTAKLRKTLCDNLKRGIIHYSEECELENLAHLSKEGRCH